MKTTLNYALKKPDYTDVVDIQDLNHNFDIIDTQLKDRATKVELENLKTVIENSEQIENKIDKIQGGKEGDILVQDNKKEIKSSGKQLTDFVTTKVFNDEKNKLIPKVTNVATNKIAVFNTDGSIKQATKTVDDIINDISWEKVKNKPNLVAKETFDTNIQSINQNIAKKANRDEVDENMRDLTVRQEQLEADMGNKDHLKTTNTTNLVSAINEVFQLGTDRGNVIKSKIGALTGKTMQNMGDVANELEKYDVVSDVFTIFSFNTDFVADNVFVYKDFLFSRENGLFNLKTSQKIPKGSKFDINNILFQYKRQQNDTTIHLLDAENNSTKSYDLYSSDYYIGFDRQQSAKFFKINGKLFITTDSYESGVEVFDIQKKQKRILPDTRYVIGSWGNEILISGNNKLHFYSKEFEKRRTIVFDISKNRICYVLNNHFMTINNEELGNVEKKGHIDVWDFNGRKKKTYTFVDNQYSFTFLHDFVKPVFGQLAPQEIYFVKRNINQNNLDYHEVYKFDDYGKIELQFRFKKVDNEIHLYASLDGKYILSGNYKNEGHKVYEVTKLLKKVR